MIEQPRHRPRGTVVLSGAKVITMRGDEVIAEGDIVVTDHRIVAVGRRGSVKVPAGARVIDVTGNTIVPGFIDTHPHWTEVRRGVLDMQNWSFFANLAYGVTAGRDPQTGTNDMFAYQDLVETGELVGPRAFSTGPGVFSEHRLPVGRRSRSRRRQVQEVLPHQHPEVVHDRQPPPAPVDDRGLPQKRSHADHRGRPRPEAEPDACPRRFQRQRARLPVVPLFGDVVELFASTGISYTPTLLVAYGGPFGETYFFTITTIHDDPKIRRFIPHEILDGKVRRSAWFHKDEHVYPLIAASAAKVARAGGHVCIGSHGEMQGIGYHWEMWALASGGWQPLEVLRAATLHGAEAIGYAQDLGSLETGKLADLVVLSADPLKDIHNTSSIRYVMKNGELFEGDTLEQIWPEKKSPPKLWWWEEKAAK